MRSRPDLSTLSFLACLLLGSASVARGETLLIAADLWCPMNCAPDSPKPGIFVELARDIFAESGIEVRYEVRNWARVLREVRRGEVNAVIGAGREDAPDFLFGEASFGLSRNCFFTRKDSTWTYTDVGSLPAVRLGVINDYSYGELINAYVAGPHADHRKVQVASGDHALDINLAKLSQDRLDAVLENSWVIQWRLAELGRSGELREAGCRKPDMPIYLAFSPARTDSARYLKLFEQGLARYRADGRFKALLSRYDVTEL